MLTGCFDVVDKVEPSFTTQIPPPPPPVAANNPPVVSGNPSSNAPVGDSWSFTPSVSDADGDSVTFFIDNQPVWARFDNATGTLSGVPQLGHVGDYPDITISVNDGTTSTALPSFNVTVQNSNSNSAPSISGTPAVSVMVGQSYIFVPNASDPDGDSLTFDIANRPGWATFDFSTGAVSGTPAASDARLYENIVISVRDGQQSASLPAFTINVQSPAPSNRAPQLSGNPLTLATVGQQYSFQPSASDPDGDDLTFLISNQPSWAAFDSATGQLSGTPLQGDAAVYGNIVISVSDGDLMASLPPFSITVSQAATGSATLTWTAPTLNTDGSPLTDLAYYKIYYGTSLGNYPNEVRVDNPGITMYVIDNLTANTYYFVSTSVNSSEIESEYSNVASKTIN